MSSLELDLPLTLWRTFSRGRRSKHTWRSFVDTFVRDPEVVRDKKRVAGFSLATFEENRRTLTRVEAVYALIFDFDAGDTTIEQAERLIPSAHNVAYTTFSHSDEWPKLRVIYPLSRPVSADEYARIWEGAALKIVRAGHALDEAARDASRFWYLPSHAPKAPYTWREVEGRLLDVERALNEAPAHTRPFPGGGSRQEQQPVPSKERGRVIDDSSAVETFFGRVFTLAGMAFEPMENDALPVVCPWASEHTSGFDGDTSTVIFPPTTEARWGLFHCSHAHCAHRQTLDLLDVLPVSALHAARVEHGRGMLRARIVNGWEQRLDPLPGVPALERFILRCRPRGDGAIFGMTVKRESAMHVRYLDGLPLPLLIGRHIDVSLEGRTVKAARLVPA